METKPSYQELERRIQELIEEKEEKFKQLLKNSFDMVVMLDENGIQRYVSESCRKILGYSPEELTDIPVIEQMIHPDDVEKVYKGFESIVKKNGHGGTHYRHRHKNGGWVYLEAYGTNQLKNPHIQSIVLNVRDISERKAAEQALVESEARLSELNATKNRFFSIIAHDLKAPFSSVLGLSEMLTELLNEKDYDQLETVAKLIQQSSLQTMNLLSNLLEWAGTQTGRVQFNAEILNVKDIAAEEKSLLVNVANQKSIDIQIDIPEDTFVQADKKMLNTILRNLISNGIKFTNTGGLIKIRAEKEIDTVVVSVSDNGIGMDNQAMNKLFKLVYSHSTPGTQREKGTGLGLLLCKEFLDLHQGKIWIKSSPGNGSTFYFTLPAAKK